MNDNFNNFNGNNNPMQPMGNQDNNGMNQNMGGNQPYMNAQPQMNQQPYMNNQPYMSYQNPEPKKNKTTLIIVIIVVALALIAGTYFAVTAINKKKAQNVLKEYENTLKKEEEEKEKINKNFTEEDYVLDNGHILVAVTNNNDVTVYGSIKVEFYDANEMLVNSEDGYIMDLGAGKTGYDDIFLSSDEIGNYAKYKVTVKLEKAFDTKLYYDKLTVESNKTDSNIMLKVTNNSEETIKNVKLSVLFYDANKKIVGYGDDHLTDVKAKETTSGKVYLPYDNNYNYLKYSSYEVIVDSAYTSTY